MIDERPDLHDETSLAPTLADWYDASAGLPGPAFWRAVLSAESARCSRYGREASVVLAQVVGLADLVELWGRDVVERGILDVVAVLRSGCRTSDYLARLGDDRVGMILTETDEVAAINMVERVRERCDLALGTRAAGGRVAFGWASPTASVSLLDAVTTAEELLHREAAAG